MKTQYYFHGDFTTKADTFKANNGILGLMAQSVTAIGEMSHLPKSQSESSIFSTTTLHGHRTRKTCGIFLSQIPIKNGLGLLGLIYSSEFAVRATRRNKTGNRANNADCCNAVVEPLPLPNQAVSSIHNTTRTLQMKNPNTNRCDTATVTPNPVIKYSLNTHNANLHSVNTQALTNRFDTETVAKNQAELTACNTLNRGRMYTAEQKTILNPFAFFGYPFGVVAKSTAEPRNSNDLTLANNRTPFNRAFFIRSIRTPKRPHSILSKGNGPIKSPLPIDKAKSMVACNEKGSPFAAFQGSQFSSLLHATAQILENLAVVPKNSTLELSQMLYKFLILGKKRLTIRILANSEQEARQRLKLSPNALCIARLNPRTQGGIYA